jgi:hypothetical protein
MIAYIATYTLKKILLIVIAIKNDPDCMLSFDGFIGGLSGLASIGILIYFTVEYSKNEHCGKLKDLSLAFIIICWVGGFGIICLIPL